jgi:hypothetical protein
VKNEGRKGEKGKGLKGHYDVGWALPTINFLGNEKIDIKRYS